MKLWVDDMRDAPDETWTECRKVQPAINAMSLFLFDEISLDHDIENRPDDETFQPVAHYLGARFLATPEWYPRVVIHSMNPTGAQTIHDILLSYTLKSEIIPYAADMARLREIYPEIK